MVKIKYEFKHQKYELIYNYITRTKNEKYLNDVVNVKL